MTFTLRPKRVAMVLGSVVACLILADIAVVISIYFLDHDYVFGLVPLFHLDFEQNIPTFFSAVVILFCAALLFVIAAARKRQGERDYRYWVGLAAIFLFLSIDEAVSIHERLTNPMRAWFGASGVFHFGWVIPYGIFVVALVLIYLRFLFQLPARIRHLILIAGAVYLTGAVGFEMVGGYYFARHGDQVDLIYSLLTTCEESLEMIGMLIFAYALMTYIASEFPGTALRIASSGSSHPGVETQREA